MNKDLLKITQTALVPAPVEQVWNFISDQEKMKQWFQADEFVMDIWEGGRIEIPLNFDGQAYRVNGEMGLILPPNKIIFSWNEKDDLGKDWFNNTMININLEEAEMGTLLTLVHEGIKYLPPEIQQDVFKRYRAFWDGSIMPRLISLVCADGNQ